jgi:lambda repressor-like predicted transcriptional regulator
VKPLLSESQCVCLQTQVENLLLRLAAAIHEARTVAELEGDGGELRSLVREMRQTHDSLKCVLTSMHPNAPPCAHDRLDAMEKAVAALEGQADTPVKAH